MATRIMDELPCDDPNSVTEWLERFDQWGAIHEAVISANDQERPVRMRALFLASIGKEAYSRLRSYMAPDLPATKTIEELITCVRTNMVPEPSYISESYKLSKLHQEANESLTSYMSRIKQLASKCNYGEAYDRMVMDKFICGVKSEKLRAYMISDNTITSSALALQKGLARELSHNAAHDMQCNSVRPGGQGSHQFSSKNKKSAPAKATVKICSKCTFRGHLAEDCRTRCKACGKVGHIAKFCRRKQIQTARQVDEDVHQDDIGMTDPSHLDEEEVHMYNCYSISKVSSVGSDQMVSGTCESKSVSLNNIHPKHELRLECKCESECEHLSAMHTEGKCELKC